MDDKLKCRRCFKHYPIEEMSKGNEYWANTNVTQTCVYCKRRHKKMKIEAKRRRRLEFLSRWRALAWT